MALFNIQTKTQYNIPKSIWDNGNYRKDIDVTPAKIKGDYKECIYNLSLSGYITLVNTCKTKIISNFFGRISSGASVAKSYGPEETEEIQHGTNLNKDIMIYNIIIVNNQPEE